MIIFVYPVMWCGIVIDQGHGCKAIPDSAFMNRAALILSRIMMLIGTAYSNFLI